MCLRAAPALAVVLGLQISLTMTILCRKLLQLSTFMMQTKCSCSTFDNFLSGTSVCTNLGESIDMMPMHNSMCITGGLYSRARFGMSGSRRPYTRTVRPEVGVRRQLSPSRSLDGFRASDWEFPPPKPPDTFFSGWPLICGGATPPSGSVASPFDHRAEVDGTFFVLCFDYYLSQ